MKPPRPTAGRARRNPDPDTDDTVVLPARESARSTPPAPPSAARVGRRAWLAAGGVVCAGCLLGAGYFLTRHANHGTASGPGLAPASPPPPNPARRPEFLIRDATERAILHNATAPGVTVFRFAHAARVLVLDFATMQQQGLMLDRVAALIEKSGTPRDRVLSEPELLAAIRNDGATIATYYYGHDYSAASLRRFFALADAAKIALGADEETLRRLLTQEGWFAPGIRRGLISIPAVGAHPDITLAARYAILHHELSHGIFFSDPDYARFVRHFWHTTLTAGERASVRRFLGSEGYDTTNEELMYNEMQAYLMFTSDPQFFRPDQVGMTAEHLARRQAIFLHGMPGGWLHDALAASLSGASHPTAGQRASRAAPT